MKKILIGLGVLAALVGLGSVGVYSMDVLGTRSAEWNYRITVEIETPEGIKSGSTVRKVKADIPSIKAPEAKTVRHKIIGEAVPINLGLKGWAFALVNWDSYEDVYRAFPTIHGKAEDTLKYYRDLKVGSKAELKEGQPMIVVFTDINDPMSVKLAYVQSWISQKEGYRTEDHFSELLGQGYKFKGITIEMTDDGVTQEIDKILTKQFWKKFNEWWATLDIREKSIKASLFGFKTGE
ncbi:MAG: hypothetical protein IAE63_00205 [Alphaproteobacteria bacterium]|nr:hypothetical protein [Alphaproteobacteria bacterium]